MKKLLIQISAVLLFSSIFVFTGCNKNENEKTDKVPDSNSTILQPSLMSANTVFVDDVSNMTYRVSDQIQLKNLVKELAAEAEDIVILRASIERLKDSKGYYEAISAKYKVGDSYVSMVVPLVKNGNKLKEEGCTMKCTSAWFCKSCEQTIIERCKKQVCKCTSESGGCSSKITFPPS